MRRGELLNLTWRDIDFDRRIVGVSPKKDTEFTWKWDIKDTDRRKLPFTDQVLNMLVELQGKMPDGCPYIFVPPQRYEQIQIARREGKWNVEQRKCPINNFTRHFQDILATAGIEELTFHDFRRTCLGKWIACGLSEFEVMTLAGHAKFETTRRFYLAVSPQTIDRARAVFQQGAVSNSVAILLQ